VKALEALHSLAAPPTTRGRGHSRFPRTQTSRRHRTNPPARPPERCESCRPSAARDGAWWPAAGTHPTVCTDARAVGAYREAAVQQGEREGKWVWKHAAQGFYRHVAGGGPCGPPAPCIRKFVFILR